MTFSRRISAGITSPMKLAQHCGYVPLIGGRGQVPKALESKYVRTITEMYLGNGYGVSQMTEPAYRELLEQLDPKGAGIALRIFVTRVSPVSYRTSLRAHSGSRSSKFWNQI